MSDDLHFMNRALEKAREAALLNEVPVGAVWVKDGEIKSSGHNLRETTQDPLGHAELSVISQAAKALGQWRLGGILYVTLEPCPMCLAALIQARIERLVFGCMDPKAGACGGAMNLAQDFPWNHQMEITRGVLETECSAVLQNFFKDLRQQKKQI